MKQTIEIRSSYLRALLEFAPKKDIRYSMNGAHFKCGPSGVIGYASDGAGMLVIRVSDAPHADGWMFAPSSWKVPRSKGDPLVWLDNEVEDGMLSATLRHLNGSLTYSDMKPTAPDFDRVIPREVSLEAAAFYRAKVEMFYAAAKVLNHHSMTPFIVPNGQSAALVQFGDPNVFGILMPMRAEIEVSPPEWFRAPARMQEAA